MSWVMPSLLEFLTWQDPRILLVPGQKLRVLNSYQSPLLKNYQRDCVAVTRCD
jgi:hypothetical protein